MNPFTFYQNNGFAFPPRSSTRNPNVLSYQPLRRTRVVWLVVVLCVIVDWRQPNAKTIFFCPLLRGRHDAPASSPIVITLHPIAPTVYHHRGQLLAGCCVPPSSGSHRNSRPCRTLYFYFFRRSIYRPKRQVNVLPTRSAPLIPTTDTIVRLVDVSNQRVAATQDRCSAAHLSIF